MDEQPTVKIVDEPTIPEHVHVPQRLEGETNEQYKMRRMFSSWINKSMRRGNMVWNSRPEVGMKGKTFRYKKVM
jgi:hypothetical protein